MIRTSANGTQYQNVFCKEKERSGRGRNSGETFVNYVGYAEIGGKVVKISVNPEMKEYNGQPGYYVTVVATTLKPRNMSMSRGGGAKF